MIRVITGFFIGSLLIGCSGTPAETGSKADQEARELLASYSNALYEKAFSQGNGKFETDYEKNMSTAISLGIEMLLPQKALLMKKAEHDLSQMLPMENIYTKGNGWEPIQAALEPDVSTFDKLIEKEVLKGSSEKYKPEDVKFLLFWRPTRTATLIRQMMLSRFLGPREFGARAMLGAFAGSHSLYALDASPEKPTIAIQTGPEVFIIGMERTTSGYYMPTSTEWLRKTD